jgi:hypothetical protein
LTPSGGLLAFFSELSSRICPAVRVRLLAALPLLLAAAATGACDGHNASSGQRVTSQTVAATFDPTDVLYRTVVVSARPHGIAGSGLWYFDVFDVENRRLDGLKTRWQSSDPALVTPLFSDVTTKGSDDMWGTAVDLRALAAGDAVVTGTVVDVKTRDDLPVTVALNVHVTGPGVSLVSRPALQAGVLDADPHRRALGNDLVALGAVAYDAAGEAIVGAKLNWACLGDAADAEFARSDGPQSWTGAGCAVSTTDADGQYVYVRGHRAGPHGFRVWLDGAPEVSAVGTIVFLDAGTGAHLELDPPAVALVVGGQRQISGVLVDGDGSRYPAAMMTLESRDVTVADALGNVVEGIASGVVPGQVQSTTFTASAGPLTAQLGVIVYRPPATVIVSPALVLAPGTESMVSAALVDTDGVTLIPASATTLTWSILDPAVATVTAGGAGDTATVGALATGLTDVVVTTAEGVVGAVPLTVELPQAGEFQPPTSSTSLSASAGPQVPGS